MLTKPWREIFDPSGSNISQVNRYIKNGDYFEKKVRRRKTL